MPRFVVLTHDHPHLHWDLMLEAGDVLWTWRLDEEPISERCERGIRATRLADHRVHYLNYEGPVSGNRGTVERWDAGTYEMTIDAAGMIHVRFKGEKLDREMKLIPTDSNDSWTFQSAES